MKPRDALLIGAVAVVIGLATADTLLEGDENRPASPADTEGASVATQSVLRGTTVEEQPAAVSPSAGALAALTGRFFFTDEDCSVVELDLAEPTPVARIRRTGSCGLWAPQTNDRLAYGAGRRDDERLWFRVVDLSEGRDSRPYLAIDSPVWSPDGQRLAWCTSEGTGFELEVGGRFRALEDCPDAYTDSGEPVYLRGREIYVENRLQRVTAGRARSVSFGTDGSVAVVTERIVEVFRSVDADDPAARATLPPYRGEPLFSPDNCGVLLRSPHRGNPPRVTLVPLGCRRLARQVVAGNEAAWSPDGRWFAVTQFDRIDIFSALEARPAEATVLEEVNQLVWKS